MTIGFNSPQEDEFALLCLGARSPYEGLLLPQSIRKAFAVADPNDLAPAEARTWRKLFCEFYDTVSLVGGGKPLILKSPAHSYRVSTLREILPDARFIVIVRNPYEVFESMVRTYRALTQKYALGPPISDDEIRETLLAERPRFENKLANGLAGLPAERRCVVRYEDLIRNPPAVIEGLYRQLELPSFEPVRETLEAEFARRSDYVQDALRPDREWSGRLSSTWAEIFERYGYPRA